MSCFKQEQDRVLNENRTMDNVQKHNIRVAWNMFYF
jgi:hypothetical protein